MSPQHEHHWLEKLVGDWRVEGKMEMGPGKPAEKTTGEETVRSIDGLWFIGEGQGEMPGGVQGTTVLTLGFDTRRNKYVGTFIGSMMTHQWVYEGELDASEKALTLTTMGPEMDERIGYDTATWTRAWPVPHPKGSPTTGPGDAPRGVGR